MKAFLIIWLSSLGLDGLCWQLPTVTPLIVSLAVTGLVICTAAALLSEAAVVTVMVDEAEHQLAQPEPQAPSIRPVETVAVRSPRRLQSPFRRMT